MFLANYDLTKIEYLKTKVPMSSIYKASYYLQVQKLNERIDTIAYLKYLESQKPPTVR